MRLGFAFTGTETIERLEASTAIASYRSRPESMVSKFDADTG
jgi:hypothetical protein